MLEQSFMEERALELRFCMVNRSAQKQTARLRNKQGFGRFSQGPCRLRAPTPTPTLCPRPCPTSVTANTRFPQGTILYHLSCSKSMKPEDL